jgi:hypothetical protein
LTHFRRIEHLNECLSAVKNCLEFFVSLQAEQYVGMPFILLLHFAHAMQALYRLSVFEIRGWDRVAVRATADVLDYAEKMSYKFEWLGNADKISDEDRQKSPFFRGLEKFKRTWENWRPVLDGVSGGINASNGDGSTGPTGDTAFGVALDDVWFSDLFNHWDMPRLDNGMSI